MLSKREKSGARFRRKRRIRGKIYGTTARPRLSVYRSNEHIYAQVIDDDNGHTIASASTLDKSLRDAVAELEGKQAAEQVGKLIAQRAVEKGIEQVVFDRNGYVYQGRVAALAEGAREGGLNF